MEAVISRLEAELAAVTAQLENPPDDPALVASLAERYEQIRAALEEQLHIWTELASD